MIEYFAMFILFLIGIHNFREGFLILQERRERLRNISENIISNNSAQCKQFKKTD